MNYALVTSALCAVRLHDKMAGTNTHANGQRVQRTVHRIVRSSQALHKFSLNVVCNRRYHPGNYTTIFLNLIIGSRSAMSNELTAPIGVKLLRSTSLEFPELATALKPFVIRRSQIEESESLAALCGRAYPNEVWDLESTKLELFQNDTVKAVLVVADTNKLLATASLQVHAPYSAQVCWVATEHKWRRHGFARALVVSLLKIAKKEGCKETYLHTTTDLLGAISLYIQLGFEPVVRNEKERDAWKDVFNALEINSRF